jgi:hypothetical protein
VGGHATKTKSRDNGTTYSLEAKRKQNVSDRRRRTWAGTTYLLEVEKEGDMSNSGCDNNPRVVMTYLLERTPVGLT